jgi:hypothetical protein
MSRAAWPYLAFFFLASGCGGNSVHDKQTEMLVQRASIDMKTLIWACEEYKKDLGLYPTDVELIYTKDQSGKGQTKYVTDRIDIDPWELKYQFALNIGKPSIASAGPDRKWGTRDDLRLTAR